MGPRCFHLPRGFYVLSMKSGRGSLWIPAACFSGVAGREYGRLALYGGRKVYKTRCVLAHILPCLPIPSALLRLLSERPGALGSANRCRGVETRGTTEGKTLCFSLLGATRHSPAAFACKTVACW